MSINPETHTCDCGFTWLHGQNGSHQCGPNYRKTIAELRAAFAQSATSLAAKEKRIRFLEKLLDAYSPKSYQYDIEHPNDGLNATVPPQPESGAMVSFYFGVSDEQAAIEAAKTLSMIGVPLNEAGAIDLAHGFMKLRATQKNGKDDAL